MIPLFLHGALGRMGRMVRESLRDHQEFALLAGIDSPAAIDELQEPLPFPLFPSVSDAMADDAISARLSSFSKKPVVIDFSRAEAIPALIEDCREYRLPLVMCTTGLSDDMKKELEALSRETSVFASPNMSLGIALLKELGKIAARILYPAGFDLEIEERHHRQKLDAPSGTALSIAEALQEALSDKAPLSPVLDRTNRRSPREKTEIGIASVRGGTVVGEHTLLFAGPDEQLEIRHTAENRRLFAGGALQAACFIDQKERGLYTMEDLIRFSLGPES